MRSVTSLFVIIVVDAVGFGIVFSLEEDRVLVDEMCLFLVL